MNARDISPVALYVLAGVAVILAIFAVMYLRARASERGAAYDDSPAAELGAPAQP